MNPAKSQTLRTSWLFSGPWWGRALVILAGMAVLVGIFYAEEAWRGKRDWNQYCRAMEARGESLDFQAYVPKAVPDDENFALTPIVQSLVHGGIPILTNDLFFRANQHVFQTNYESLASHRHLTDLVGWQMAGSALQAGELKPDQQFESDSDTPDGAMRQAAAMAVLEG